MEEHDQVQPGEVAIHASGDSRENVSLLDALADQRNEIAASHTTMIPIPGYERSGMTLMAEYTVIDGKDLAEIGRKVTREYRSKGQSYERNLYASIDVMIASCTGIYVDRDGSVIQLRDNDGEPITGYSQELASALRYEAQTARQCVLGVFVNNVAALQQHSMLLGRWMGNTTTDVIGELLDAGGNL